ncbi:MAG: CRISPR-associated helicase Cas3' [Planctomycetes bacterium]|nr:CRISPR-associated helicase Cas3' [Planctomycetota bacterium]
MNLTFDNLFQRATETPKSLPYQERLAIVDPYPTLLDVPTGLGKTAAAILAWLWRRRFAHKDTPRRLVYCLPMRVLVEQTFTEAVKWLDRLSLLAGSAEWTERGPDGLPIKRAQLQRSANGHLRGYLPEPAAAYEKNGWAATNGDLGQYPIAVHLLLGGEENSDWALWPERDAILIGTQDMLISRALNRGYAAGRARWPLEFGLLNTDCLWVFDEIQIMDTSLATSLQLDAWRQSLRLRPSRDAFPTDNENHLPKPCQSLWMSATMAKHWLERAVDWSPCVTDAWSHRVQLGLHQLPGGHTVSDDDSERVRGLFANKKALEKNPVATLTVPKGKDSKPDVTGYLDRLVPQISQHKAADALTLVIVNTVDRAVGIYRQLKKKANDTEVFLIHSRFRPMERERWSAFLNQKDDKPRIVVSTQVVEAGVDLSAKVLFTELAPWASLVQRFGRCARFIAFDDQGKVINEHGRVYWMDIAANERAALPYSVEELKAAKEQLEVMANDGVGLQALKNRRSEIDEKSTTLFPYEPRFVPHDKDLFDLFDTTPDLTGADVDISRFIRDGEELDVHVFWRESPSGVTPLKKDRPHRRELCPVPFHRFRELLPALRKAGSIWRRSYRRGWELIDQRDSEQVYPGQVFMLEKSCGGYNRNLGWTGVATDRNFDLLPPTDPTKATAQDDEEDADDLSQINAWLTVEEHTRDVCAKLEALLKHLGWAQDDCSVEIKGYVKILRLAARLHDWGKAHAAFAAKLDAERLHDPQVASKLAGQPAAKAPDPAWRTDKIRHQPRGTPEADRDRRRPGFRHELASALAILEALYRAKLDHDAFAWPDSLDKGDFREVPNNAPVPALADDPLMKEVIALSADDFDLLVYLVAAHHGKVRMSLRSSQDDDRDDVPDPCPSGKRQARGVRDGDEVPACKIPNGETPAVAISLDPMELGLSPRYGASWRERTQLLLERLGPFQLSYLEALLRAADCRASAEEDERGKEVN